MNLFKSIIFVFLFTLTSCFTQPPAPVEYHGSKYATSSLEREKAKYSNMTESSLPEDEPIKSSTLIRGDEEISSQATDKTVILVPAKQAKFIMPVVGVVEKKFHQAEGAKSEGIYIKAANGAPVKAIADGEVTFSGKKPESFGNFIIIKHANNTFSAYAHLKDLLASKGEFVKQGDIIGHVGKTGNVQEFQLYFALKMDNKPIDPLLYITME